MNVHQGGKFSLASPESIPVIYHLYTSTEGAPVPLAARSKAWVCCRSLAGITGSNAAGGMDVCFM